MFAGLVFSLIGYIEPLRFLFVSPTPYIVLLSATLFYLLGLWADKADKYLSKKDRDVFWLCALFPTFYSLMHSGLVFMALFYVLKFFHLLRPFAILLNRLLGLPQPE